MVCVRKLVGNLNGKYNKQCKALKTHLFTEEVHIENSMLVKRKKVSLDKKQEKRNSLLLPLEMQGVEFGKAYAQVIDDVSSKSFKPSFETYINKDTTVITNEWNGYKP